jgi:hypothetical protein
MVYLPVYFLGQLVSGKWQNVRDCFIKSLKKKSGQAISKNYIYHDNLQFLMKIVQKDDTVSSLERCQPLPDSGDEKQEETVVEVQSQDEAKITCNPRKRRRLQQDIEREMLKALRDVNTAQDEDEAFFASLIPSVKRMSADEKSDFRIIVLQTIKDFDNRRKEKAVFETSRSSATTSASPTIIQNPGVMDDNIVVSQYLNIQCD